VGALAIVHSRSAPPDAAVVERMLQAAPHRGPELAVRVCGQAALGVSNDPEFRDAWIAEDDSAVAVFAGTLDNREELAAELRRDGVELGRADPAVVVLAGFRAWGDRLAERLRGAFTGGISDGSTLRCFRDHIGFRSLFFRDESRGVFVATEAKQIVAGAGVTREPDLEGLENLFWGGGPKNALRGIERFPRGSRGTLHSDGSWSVTGYWDPAGLLETARLTVDDACDRLLELFDQAIGRTVTGTDAIWLSGGIDSPTVAAFAAPRHLELAGRPLRAVSAVFPHLPSVDERHYIELVSDYLKLELHTYVPQARSLDDIEFWVRILDAPVDTLSIPETAEGLLQARRSGARTVLSGELFEYAATARQFAVAHLILHGRWRAAARRVREQRKRGRPWLSIVRPLLLEMAPPFVATRVARWRERDYRHLPMWMDVEKAGGRGYRPDLAIPARRRWSWLQLTSVGAGSASPNMDANEICAAYCGARLRYPLVDVDLWEFLLRLPAEVKFPDRVLKRLVRDAMHGRLPEEILWRRDKTSFDEHVLGTAEYPELRRWILGTNGYRMPGVDYRLLAERLEREELGVFELQRSRDLARIHAFVSQFE
jgi:asparagine synthase (glutamine-hydrolysing)